MDKAGFWWGPMRDQAQALNWIRLVAVGFVLLAGIGLPQLARSPNLATLGASADPVMVFGLPAVLLWLRYSVWSGRFLAVVSAIGIVLCLFTYIRSDAGLVMLAIGLFWVFVLWLTFRACTAAKFLRGSKASLAGLQGPSTDMSPV